MMKGIKQRQSGAVAGGFNSQGSVFASPSPPDRRQCGSGNNPSWSIAVGPHTQQIPHLEHGD